MLTKDERRRRYVRRVVDNETKRLAMSVHARNFDDRLFACAAKLGNWCATGYLAEEDAADALRAVVHDVSDIAQARRTIARGLARGMEDPTLAKWPAQLTLREAS